MDIDEEIDEDIDEEIGKREVEHDVGHFDTILIVIKDELQDLVELLQDEAEKEMVIVNVREELSAN